VFAEVAERRPDRIRCLAERFAWREWPVVVQAAAQVLAEVGEGNEAGRRGYRSPSRGRRAHHGVGMENILEIAVWVAAGLLVLVLLCVGMAVAIDRSPDQEAKARQWNSSTWLGGFFLAMALLAALPMLWDSRPYVPWKHMAVARWQVWTASVLLAVVGVRLLIVGRRFPVAPAAASHSDDIASQSGEEQR
jgi:hypothetical protein